MNHTGHELYKCARVTGHTNKFVFQWFNSCYRSFLFHLCIILYFLFAILNFYVVHVLCCICKFYLLAIHIWFSQCKTSECLVSFKFLSLSWMDHFITKSCYYQTKIFAGLVICVLATSLFSFSRAVNSFFLTYLFFIA